MVRILVVCTPNSARSQMAEAFLRRLLGQKAQVCSAGTHPTRLHPLAQAVMHEIGCDLSFHTSDPIDKYRDQAWEYVITVCDSARETCPYVPAREHLHVSFPDPSEGDIETFRRVRDAIHAWAQPFSQAVHASLT